MRTKIILFTCILVLGLNSYSQDLPTISFKNLNSIVYNSKLEMTFSFMSYNDTTTVYCNIYNKKFEKKISNNEYKEIIYLVKKITSADILSRDDLYLDPSYSTISISNLQSSVKFTIPGLHQNDNRKEYLHFKNAVIKILDVVDLNLSDLK